MPTGQGKTVGMTNPFILDVRDIATGLTEQVDTSGSSPARWGGEMFAVAEGSPVEVHGVISNLGEAVMVDATVEGTADLTCSLCLTERTTPVSYRINDVFGFSPDFIKANPADADSDDSDSDEVEESLLVDNETIDITQLVINEAGLNAPFSPVCADFGFECADAVPQPDGDSETAAADSEAIDPRWAGLEKFK